MTVFDVLTLIGGLCLFLFGMNLMGQALERRAGSRLQVLLARLTTGKIKGLLTGLGVTSVIQSSSATTVMVVGFVNSGLMTLRQAINVIMGANIGTTVTAWILSLGGISSDNVFVQLLKPTSFTPVLALIGIIFYMFCKSEKKKDTATILLGFAVLMFGMDTMTGAVSGLKDVPAFQNLFIAFKNPILGVLAGAILTGIIQSSSASVGILQALALTGAVSYGAAIPIIMGQNIGTCVTALLSSFGTNRNAKRAAMVHLSFNVIGTIVWLSVFSIVMATVNPMLFNESATIAGIAVAHSLFNIACTSILLPMSGLLEKLAYVLVPEGKTPDTVVKLDERLLATPGIAMERCNSLTFEMAECAAESFKLGAAALSCYDENFAERVRMLEERSDRYEDVLGSYLVKLSAQQLGESESLESAKLLKAIGDFERISDHSVGLVRSAEEMHAKGISFTEQGKRELGVLTAAVGEIVELTLHAFGSGDIEAAQKIEPLEQVIDKLKSTLRSRHIERLQQGLCGIEAGFVWSDLLTNLSRTSDHCSNIAGGIIDSAAGDMTTHETLRALKKETEDFKCEYLAFLEKYRV